MKRNLVSATFLLVGIAIVVVLVDRPFLQFAVLLSYVLLLWAILLVLGLGTGRAGSVRIVGFGMLLCLGPVAEWVFIEGWQKAIWLIVALTLASAVSVTWYKALVELRRDEITAIESEAFSMQGPQSPAGQRGNAREHGHDRDLKDKGG